jgi:Spy/CpxP family protein refolding chaperone
MDDYTRCAGCLLLVAVVAWGQTPAATPGQDPEQASVPERVELLRMWRMVEALQIGEEQASRLFPLWSQRNRDRRELQERRHQAIQELAGLLGQAQVEDKALRAQTGRVQALDQEREKLARRFHAGEAELLTVRQQAQLLLFNERFREDLRGMLKDFRGPLRTRGGADAVSPPSWWERIEKSGRQQ